MDYDATQVLDISLSDVDDDKDKEDERKVVRVYSLCSS